MMTEAEALVVGQHIADDVPQAEEVSVVHDRWTGRYGVYVHVHIHEAVIVTPQEWPTQVLAAWLAESS